MRLMFTAMAAAGHVRPLAPIAYAALRRGHEVLVCTPEPGRGHVAAFGLPYLPAGIDWVGSKLRELAASRSDPEQVRVRFNADITAQGLAGEPALAMARDIVGAASSWRPDVVVRENTEFGGYLAAEMLGVPHVSVGVAGGKSDRLAELLATAVDALRVSSGLRPDPQGARIHAFLHASLVPPQLYPTPSLVPHARCYRQTNPLPPGDTLPDWLGDELSDGRPLVLASFGTILPGMAAFGGAPQAVVAGLGELDCTAIVLTGDAVVEPVPGNVRLLRRAPQPLLLECCDLFVTHGGFNSVREALRQGVPMVIIPWLTDSRRNAARCADLGVAKVVDAASLTPAGVRDACAAVLREHGYRRSARQMQRRMLVLPDMDTLVADIEALVSR